VEQAVRGAEVVLAPTHELRVSVNPTGRVSAVHVVRIRMPKGKPLPTKDASNSGVRIGPQAPDGVDESVAKAFAKSTILSTVYFRQNEKRPGSSEGPSIGLSALWDDPEYPADWNPETDPYPESAFASVIDAAIQNIESLTNATLANTQAILDDPYSDDFPDDDGFAISPAVWPTSKLVGETPLARATFSINNYLTNDPCIDQKENIELSASFLLASFGAALVGIALLPATATAAATTIALGGIATELGLASFTHNTMIKQLARCKKNNSWFYPRRP
jgi:hypothetical protein